MAAPAAIMPHASVEVGSPQAACKQEGPGGTLLQAAAAERRQRYRSCRQPASHRRLKLALLSLQHSAEASGAAGAHLGEGPQGGHRAEAFPGPAKHPLFLQCAILDPTGGDQARRALLCLPSEAHRWPSQWRQLPVQMPFLPALFLVFFY